MSSTNTTTAPTLNQQSGDVLSPGHDEADGVHGVDGNAINIEKKGFNEVIGSNNDHPHHQEQIKASKAPGLLHSTRTGVGNFGLQPLSGYTKQDLSAFPHHPQQVGHNSVQNQPLGAIYGQDSGGVGGNHGEINGKNEHQNLQNLQNLQNSQYNPQIDHIHSNPTVNVPTTPTNTTTGLHDVSAQGWSQNDLPQFIPNPTISSIPPFPFLTTNNINTTTKNLNLQSNSISCYQNSGGIGNKNGLSIQSSYSPQQDNQTSPQPNPHQISNQPSSSVQFFNKLKHGDLWQNNSQYSSMSTIKQSHSTPNQTQHPSQQADKDVNLGNIYQQSLTDFTAKFLGAKSTPSKQFEGNGLKEMVEDLFVEYSEYDILAQGGQHWGGFGGDEGNGARKWEKNEKKENEKVEKVEKTEKTEKTEKEIKIEDLNNFKLENSPKNPPKTAQTSNNPSQIYQTVNTAPNHGSVPLSPWLNTMPSSLTSHTPLSTHLSTQQSVNNVKKANYQLLTPRLPPLNHQFNTLSSGTFSNLGHFSVKNGAKSGKFDEIETFHNYHENDDENDHNDEENDQNYGEISFSNDIIDGTNSLLKYSHGNEVIPLMQGNNNDNLSKTSNFGPKNKNVKTINSNFGNKNINLGEKNAGKNYPNSTKFGAKKVPNNLQDGLGTIYLDQERGSGSGGGGSFDIDDISVIGGDVNDENNFLNNKIENNFIQNNVNKFPQIEEKKRTDNEHENGINIDAVSHYTSLTEYNDNTLIIAVLSPQIVCFTIPFDIFLPQSKFYKKIQNCGRNDNKNNKNDQHFEIKVQNIKSLITTTITSILQDGPTGWHQYEMDVYNTNTFNNQQSLNKIKNLENNNINNDNNSYYFHDNDSISSQNSRHSKNSTNSTNKYFFPPHPNRFLHFAIRNDEFSCLFDLDTLHRLISYIETRYQALMSIIKTKEIVFEAGNIDNLNNNFGENFYNFYNSSPNLDQKNDQTRVDFFIVSILRGYLYTTIYEKCSNQDEYTSKTDISPIDANTASNNEQNDGAKNEENPLLEKTLKNQQSSAITTTFSSPSDHQTNLPIWIALRISQGDMSSFEAESGLVSIISSHIAKNNLPMFALSTNDHEYCLIPGDLVKVTLSTVFHKFSNCIILDSTSHQLTIPQRTLNQYRNEIIKDINSSDIIISDGTEEVRIEGGKDREKDSPTTTHSIAPHSRPSLSIISFQPPLSNNPPSQDYDDDYYTQPMPFQLDMNPNLLFNQTQPHLSQQNPSYPTNSSIQYDQNHGMGFGNDVTVRGGHHGGEFDTVSTTTSANTTTTTTASTISNPINPNHNHENKTVLSGVINRSELLVAKNLTHFESNFVSGLNKMDLKLKLLSNTIFLVPFTLTELVTQMADRILPTIVSVLGDTVQGYLFGAKAQQRNDMKDEKSEKSERSEKKKDVFFTYTEIAEEVSILCDMATLHRFCYDNREDDLLLSNTPIVEYVSSIVLPTVEDVLLLLKNDEKSDENSDGKSEQQIDERNALILSQSDCNNHNNGNLLLTRIDELIVKRFNEISNLTYPIWLHEDEIINFQKKNAKNAGNNFGQEKNNQKIGEKNVMKSLACLQYSPSYGLPTSLSRCRYIYLDHIFSQLTPQTIHFALKNTIISILELIQNKPDEKNNFQFSTQIMNNLFFRFFQSLSKIDSSQTGDILSNQPLSTILNPIIHTLTPHIKLLLSHLDDVLLCKFLADYNHEKDDRNDRNDRNDQNSPQKTNLTPLRPPMAPPTWAGRSWRVFQLDGQWDTTCVGLVATLSKVINDIGKDHKSDQQNDQKNEQIGKTDENKISEDANILPPPRLCPLYLSTYKTDYIAVPHYGSSVALQALLQHYSVSSNLCGE
jgi:hypothetical protein